MGLILPLYFFLGLGGFFVVCIICVKIVFLVFESLLCVCVCVRTRRTVCV